MMIKLTPLGKRLVFPDGHVEEGFAVEFESEMDEIAALKAERDKLKEWCRKLIEGGTFPGEADGLRAERDHLRAALMQIRKAVLNGSRKSYIDDVARRALGERK